MCSSDLALSGEVKVGDSLWLTGVNKPMRVRALHAQNQPTETAHAGQRIALNIAGDADLLCYLASMSIPHNQAYQELF